MKAALSSVAGAIAAQLFLRPNFFFEASQATRERRRVGSVSCGTGTCTSSSLDLFLGVSEFRRYTAR
jgi:hypothetical protein